MKSYSFRNTEGRRGARAVSLVPVILLVAGATAMGQTRIDLATQGKHFDFSGAASTKPSKTGTQFPATCAVGETFIKTDGAAGQNFFVCLAGNAWSMQGGMVPGVTGFANMVLATDGTALLWKALGGDVSGAPGSLTVSRLQGRNVSAAAPGAGQLLVWNGSTLQWEPQTLTLSQVGGTIGDAQLGAGINATKIGGGTVGDMAFSYLSNVTSDLQTQLNAKAAANHTHTVNGDASGALTGLTITGLQNRVVSGTAPGNGQALVWNSAAAQWQPQNVAGGVSGVFGRTGAVAAQMGDYSFNQISGTITDAQVGTGINAGKIGSGTVSNTVFGYLANVSGDLQAQLNGKASTSQTLTGDLSGSLSVATVAGLRNRSVSATAPQGGQALVWNSTLMQWEPQNQIGGLPSVFGRTGAVTAQTGDYSFSQISGTISDSQLGAGINAGKIGSGTVSNTTLGYLANVTSDVQAQLNGKAAAAHTHTLTGDVSGSLTTTTVTALQNRAVSATAPSNGQTLVWSSALSQWLPQSQNGAVATVFGRNGSVVAQTGDYAFSQISGAVTDSQVSTGLNASKIGSGSVGNTAFSYLANVTSDLQAQLTGKALANQPLAGDLSGTLVSPTVAALQSRAVSSAAPGAGQVLAWNATSAKWEPTNPATVSGGYSSSFSSQTSVTIPGTVHQLGTANLLVGCYDTGTPNMRVQPNSVGINPSTYDVAVTFATPQSGRCVVSAGGSGSGGGGGATMAAQLGDFNVTWTTSTVLTIGANCSVATPCNVRLGSNVYRFVNAATLTLTGGTGIVYVYISSSGALTAGHNLTLSCNASCTAMSGVSGFPADSIPLYTWTAISGAWDTNGGVDKRAVLGNRLLTHGAGIVTLDSGASTSVSVDFAVVPSYLTATASLSFPAIANGSCATDKTFTLTGAAVGDSVAPAWPGGIEPGLLGTMWVSAANTISVRLCNLSGASVTPAGATFRGTIVRSF